MAGAASIVHRIPKTADFPEVLSALLQDDGLYFHTRVLVFSHRSRKTHSNAGTFPNNRRYPLLLYKAAFSGKQKEGSDLLLKNKWTRCVLG